MNGGMKNSQTNMSGVQEGSAKPFKNSSDYVKQPGNSYGKGPSGLQPTRARTKSYSPDTKMGANYK